MQDKKNANKKVEKDNTNVRTSNDSWGDIYLFICLMY